MNTVGRPGGLARTIRCVVSVSMLTEGWDANTVTHILGVRAFGTQLLCEQVVGRGLRRVSYEVDPETGFFPVEYAEVLGVPFSFARAVAAMSRPAAAARHARQGRWRTAASSEIRFPGVEGYRVRFPRRPLKPVFDEDSRHGAEPGHDVPNVTEQRAGRRGRRSRSTCEGCRAAADEVGDLRRGGRSCAKVPDEDGNVEVWRYPELVRITEQWFERTSDHAG